MSESYKDRFFNLVCENVKELKWVRDDNSSYQDYECKVGEYLKLRLVSTNDGKYLQVLRGAADYKIYDETEYPKVSLLLEVVRKQLECEREEEFFKNALNKFEIELEYIKNV